MESVARIMPAVLLRLIREEDGQDVIEYGLLAAGVGITSIVALTSLLGVMDTSYTSWIDASYNLWVTPDPLGP